MNDILLAALYIAIADWNEEHRTGARRIAVMVPVNLRPSDWQQEVVGNVLLPVRVSTGPSDRSSPMAVLEAVVEQSRRIKESGTGGALIEALGRSTSIPVGPRTPHPRCSGRGAGQDASRPVGRSGHRRRTAPCRLPVPPSPFRPRRRRSLRRRLCRGPGAVLAL